MSEPITLYKDDATVTVYAPSVALDLQAQGWTNEPDADSGEVPFDFAPVAGEPAVEHIPAKRGRPRKAQK